MVKVKASWQSKILAEWLKMFPEDTPISIHSYGVWFLIFGSIQHFNTDLKREKEKYYSNDNIIPTSKTIVKRIYQDPVDHERLIFDIKGDEVHLWNETLMENKDPNVDMMPGLKVPLKEGINVDDVDALFCKRIDEWESKPFYMDNFAKSCLTNTDCLEMGNDS